jgi:hypothetical protein
VRKSLRTGIDGGLRTKQKEVMAGMAHQCLQQLAVGV